MTKQITIKGKTWVLKTLPSGWVDLRYKDTDKNGKEILSRTQLKGIDTGACLQYIYTTHNGNIEPINESELIDAN